MTGTKAFVMKSVMMRGRGSELSKIINIIVMIAFIPQKCIRKEDIAT